MAQLLKLIIVTVFLGMAASEFIPFPGGDTKFHEWLNIIYTRTTIDQKTMQRVQKYVKETIKQITDIVKATDDCFDFVRLRGSTAEGLKIVFPDEFDFVMYNQRDKNKIFFDEKQGLPGFAFAIRKGAGSTCFDKFKLKDPKGAIDPVKTRDHMKTLVILALHKLGIKSTVTEVGPAINFFLPSKEATFPEIDIDLVLYLQQANWPKSAITDLKPDLKALGVGLVPKVIEDDNRVWLISFSDIEVKLFQNIDADGGIRKKLLRVAKYLKLATKWPKTVSSYNLKTIVMKMNHKNPSKAFWSESKLVARFRDLMKILLTSLQTTNLRSFFIPSYNLFRGKDLKEALQIVKQLIKTIETDPNSLLPPPHGLLGLCNKNKKAASSNNTDDPNSKKRSVKETLLMRRLRSHC